MCRKTLGIYKRKLRVRIEKKLRVLSEIQVVGDSEEVG